MGNFLPICFSGTWFQVVSGHIYVSFPLPWAGPHPSPSPAPGYFPSGFTPSFPKEHRLFCLALHPHGFRVYFSRLLSQARILYDSTVTPCGQVDCITHLMDERLDAGRGEGNGPMSRSCQVAELEHKSVLLTKSSLSVRL